MNESNHILELEVRDYECDMQGVVNNAVYQNYLEHARHVFLASQGIDFSAMTARKIHLVVIQAELKYRTSLKSRDSFLVETAVERRSRLKFVFLQKIWKKNDGCLVLDAVITGTALNPDGRPRIPPEIETLAPYTEGK